VLIPGYGHSRLAKHPDAALTASVGVRLISLDLPGLGKSSPKPGYTLLSWVDDVTELLDALRIERFAAVGWSWGAPYALALAHSLSERVLRVGVVSGMCRSLTGPGAAKEVKSEFRSFGMWCRYIPPAARAFLKFQSRGFLHDPEGSVQREAAQTGGDDALVVSDPEIAQMLVASAREVWNRGTEGMFEHSRAVALPWMFNPAEIASPMMIWHGEGDHEISSTMAVKLAKDAPATTLNVVPGRGHLLLFAEWARLMASVNPNP